MPETRQLKESTISTISRKSYLSQFSGNTAIFGQRKSGKTSLIKEHLKTIKDGRVQVVLSLEKLSLNPENFAVEFIGNICYWHLGGKSQYINYLDINFLKNTIKSQKAGQIIHTVSNELLKIKPDQQVLLKSAFDFPDALGQDLNKKFVVVLEEFERILDLNNFSQIKDVLALLDFNKKNAEFIITTSFWKGLEKLTGFKKVILENLSKKECSEYIKANLPNIEEKIIDEFYLLTDGQLYFLKNLVARFKETHDLKKAYLIELSYTQSPTSLFCKEFLNDSLSRARGATLLFSILKSIAICPGLKLTDVAKKIFHSAPVTKALIERLVEVNLLTKKDNKFYFASAVLSGWVRHQALGIEYGNLEELK